MRLTTKTVWAAFVVALFITFTVLELLFPLAPGYCVAILAALAVVMTLIIPKEPSKSEKVLWMMGAFVLMVLEMFGVSHDRKQQEMNFQTIVNRLTTNIQQSQQQFLYSTGGDEFCFLVPIPPGIGSAPAPIGRWPVYVGNSGNVPLPFCDVSISALPELTDSPEEVERKLNESMTLQLSNVEANGPNTRMPTGYSIIPGRRYSLRINTPLHLYFENIEFIVDSSRFDGYRITWRVFDLQGKTLLNGQN